ncbi:class I SAM-dependent methyltransferase [Metabacillus malikii]|uniref:SAM-dependent methyltransferase n=1 Tax=Metabacillus malikii TaxID=1504265 RepID=A0ABT9ZJX4_9BACI|nr:class I SAM-dependent methyltransferase [Metabacillus malikii]MDQ0232589.1 SAM-dependent methyltransferase [Metabacillus malikii]
MVNQKVLYDVMRHQEWVPPHSDEWYSQLGGKYNYPWKSEFEEPTAEMVLSQKIDSYVNENFRILDVGCGHGEFTYQWSSKVKEVVGIDVIEEFIYTANINKPSDSLRFITVNANEKVPFPDDYFDLVYSKKGPWISVYSEANRITKRGVLVIGLYHGGTDGGLRDLFPGLYHPMPVNPYDLEYISRKFEFDKSELTDFNIEVIEEVEYLSTPEDVLIKKCFGQNEALKAVAWKECLKDIEEIFYKNATSKGLKVINYYHLITARTKLG